MLGVACKRHVAIRHVRSNTASTFSGAVDRPGDRDQGRKKQNRAPRPITPVPACTVSTCPPRGPPPLGLSSPMSPASPGSSCVSTPRTWAAHLGAGTRAETIVSDHQGRGVTLTGELALDQDGNFLAMRIEWLINLGAYCSNAGPFINTAASPTSMAGNVYRPPACYGLIPPVFTHTPPAPP